MEKVKLERNAPHQKEMQVDSSNIETATYEGPITPIWPDDINQSVEKMIEFVITMTTGHKPAIGWQKGIPELGWNEELGMELMYWLPCDGSEKSRQHIIVKMYRNKTN